MFKRNLIIFFASLALCGTAYGQITVRGYFLKDSIKIGETVPYVLTASYPKELNVVFPDSTYSFAPFEIESKKFFKTHTENNRSKDSVVYTLSSFEIDNIQVLGLPVFILNQKDSTVIDAAADSIFLKEIVTHVPDSVSVDKLALKTNTAYLNVKWALNYPIILIIVGGLLIIAVVMWIIFRKKIRRYFRIKRLTKKHLAFVQKFGNVTRGGDFTFAKAEEAIVLWKFYMENLLDRPFAKSTSKEIIRMQKDEQLGKNLYAIDRMLYGKNQPVPEPFSGLQEYSEKLFQKRIEETT